MVYFRRFLSFADKKFGFNSAREFLIWAKSQQDGVAVEEAIETFAETQKPSARQTTVSALKTFLERNGYRGLPKMPVARSPRVFYHGYQRDQILRVLSFLDNNLEKAFVLFAKDSGLRAQTILSLRYHHVKPDLEAGIDYCHLYLEPAYFEGRKTAGLTFIGPNTVKVLRELVKQGRVKASSVVCDPGKCCCERIFPFKYTTLNAILNLAKKKAGVEKKVQPSHGLRKFFENALKKLDPPLDDDKKNQLEGHSLGVRWHYTDQDVEELRGLYKRAYLFLDLSEQAAVDLKVKQLADEVKVLRDQLARYRDLEREIENLKNELSGRLSEAAAKLLAQAAPLSLVQRQH